MEASEDVTIDYSDERDPRLSRAGRLPCETKPRRG